MINIKEKESEIRRMLNEEDSYHTSPNWKVKYKFIDDIDEVDNGVRYFVFSTNADKYINYLRHLATDKGYEIFVEKIDIRESIPVKGKKVKKYNKGLNRRW